MLGPNALLNRRILASIVAWRDEPFVRACCPVASGSNKDGMAEPRFKCRALVTYPIAVPSSKEDSAAVPPVTGQVPEDKHVAPSLLERSAAFALHEAAYLRELENAGMDDVAAKQRAVNAAFNISYLVLPTVSMTQFRGLNCQTFESGHAYLRVDTSVWCDTDSSDYARLLSINIPMIIIYQSIPFGWLALLVYYRRRPLALDPARRHPHRPGRRRRLEEGGDPHGEVNRRPIHRAAHLPGFADIYWEYNAKF